MNKIRVLNMVYWLGSGGIERFSVECYRHINKDIIEMDFVTKSNVTEFYDDDIRKLGAKKIPLSLTGSVNGISNKFKMLVRACSLFRNKYDVAYFNISSPADALKYPLISRILGIKRTIVHAHSSSDSKQGYAHRCFNSLGRIYLEKSSIMKFACSDSAALWMFGKKVYTNNLYIDIKNGIDTSKYLFNPIRKDIGRERIGIPKEALVIGQIGRFVELKNHKFTIDVAAEIIKKGIDAYFVFAGDGKLKEECEKYAESCGLKERILFLGNRKDIPDILQGIDIFVMPSLYEGLPVSAIEAQASGCVCLFSKAITHEVDVTGNCGFFPLEKKLWVQEILNYVPCDRTEALENVIRAGYDITRTSQLVEKKILELSGDSY